MAGPPRGAWGQVWPLGHSEPLCCSGGPEPGRKEFPRPAPQGLNHALLTHGGESLARVLTSHLSSGGVHGVKRKTYVHAPLFSGTPRQNRALLKMRKSSER